MASLARNVKRLNGFVMREAAKRTLCTSGLNGLRPRHTIEFRPARALGRARSMAEERVRRRLAAIQRASKAAVLPVPVWAMPSISLPARSWGMARAWIGVGMTWFLVFNARWIGSAKPSSEKLLSFT